jgi:hypothetical protein
MINIFNTAHVLRVIISDEKETQIQYYPVKKNFLGWEIEPSGFYDGEQHEDNFVSMKTINKCYFERDNKVFKKRTIEIILRGGRYPYDREIFYYSDTTYDDIDFELHVNKIHSLLNGVEITTQD